MREVWKRQQVHEDARNMHRAKTLVPKNGKWFKRHLGGHDVVRLDRQGEVLIWCRKCSGNARQRMGPKLRKYCKPEQVGTREYGKMLKRSQVLEDGRVPAEEARNTELREKSVRGFQISLKRKVSWRTKDCGISLEKMCCRTGALPEEEGDVLREQKACMKKNS